MAEGRLRLSYADSGEQVIVSPEHPGIIRPEQPHRVEPIGGIVMHIEFFRERPNIARSAEE